MQVPLWFHDLVTDWLHPGDSQHLVARMAKNLPTEQDTRVQSLVREDPLEKEMATYSSILARRILWTEEPGRLQSMDLQRFGYDQVTNTDTHTHIHIQRHTHTAY